MIVSKIILTSARHSSFCWIEEGSQYQAGCFDLNNKDNLVYTILSKVSDLCLKMELTETNFQNMQLQFDSKLNVVDEKICQIFEENI